MNPLKRVLVISVRRKAFCKGASVYRGDTTQVMNARVLPNLPPDPVVVIDNTPYHGKQEDKVSTKLSTNQ